MNGYRVGVHRCERMKQILIEITEFRTALVAWFKRDGRKLPWRETADPYAILVSELMLQQTQVATVLAYYQRWFETIPNDPRPGERGRIRGSSRLARARILQSGPESSQMLKDYCD